jgi:hypothetical protein
MPRITPAPSPARSTISRNQIEAYKLLIEQSSWQQQSPARRDFFDRDYPLFDWPRRPPLHRRVFDWRFHA